MRDIAARYPDPRSGMLSCLHLVQEVAGYVTPEGIMAVAEALGAKPDEVESVVTFYSMYRRAPAGRYILKVCTSISCYLRGCLRHGAGAPGQRRVRRACHAREGGCPARTVTCGGSGCAARW